MQNIDRHAISYERDGEVTRDDAWAGFFLELLPLPIQALLLSLIWVVIIDTVPRAIEVGILLAVVISSVSSGQGWLRLGDRREALMAFGARVAFSVVLWSAATINRDLDVGTLLGVVWLASLVMFPVGSSLLLARKWWPLTDVECDIANPELRTDN